MEQQKRLNWPQLLTRPEAVGLLMVLLLTWVLTQFPADPRTFPDDYLHLERQSFFSKDFWLGSRPPAITLFYRFCGYDLGNAVFGQQAFSVLCWAFLGVVLARTWKNRFASGVVPVFALAACSWNIGAWSFAILTESVSFSLFALFVGLLIMARQKGSLWSCMALAVVTFFFSFTRDQVAYLLFTVVWLNFALSLLLKREQEWRWMPLILALVYSIVFLVQSHLGQIARRHEFPMTNVFLQRILADEALTSWFKEQGAPLHLMEEDSHEWVGQWTSSYNFELYRNAKFKPWRAWVMEEAKGTYLRFLITHPAYTLQTAWAARTNILSHSLDYVKKKDDDPLAMKIGDLLWQPSFRWSWWNILQLGVVLLYIALLWPARLDPLPLVLGACSLINGIFAFHADAMEVARHCVFTGIGLQTAWWYAVVVLISHCFPKQEVAASDSAFS